MDAAVLLVVPATLVASLGLVVLVVLSATARPDHTLSSEVASARRHGLVTSVLAMLAFMVVIGLLIVLVSLPAGDGLVRPTPLWLGTLPLIGAVVALGVLAVGELTWPRPRGQQRQAHLNPRSIRDALPSGWLRALVGLGALTVAVICLGIWAADPSGHALTYSDRPGHRQTMSPFPGTEYGVPQLVALGVALLALYGVLRLVALRPAVVRSDVPTDNHLRSASAVRAVRVVVAALALTTAGDLFFGGSAGVRLYGPGWQQALSGGAMLMGACLGLVGTLLVLAPAPRLPRIPAVPLTGATSAS